MLTKEEKLDMVLNHFDRESDVEHAMWLLDDYERVVAKKQQEAQSKELNHRIKLLADVLGRCIVASGIVRKDISGLSGPELLQFGEDLCDMLSKPALGSDAGGGVANTTLLDVCTDPDNCKRCNTHPNHRSGLAHAGIPAADWTKKGGA